MKIDSSLKAGGASKLKGNKTGKSRILPVQSQGENIRDEVELTDRSAHLQELEARLSELEITDPQKIEAIRQAILDGSFKVDEEVVADALIRETLDQLRHLLKR